MEPTDDDALPLITDRMLDTSITGRLVSWSCSILVEVGFRLGEFGIRACASEYFPSTVKGQLLPPLIAV